MRRALLGAMMIYLAVTTKGLPAGTKMKYSSAAGTVLIDKLKTRVGTVEVGQEVGGIIDAKRKCTAKGLHVSAKETILIADAAVATKMDNHNTDPATG